MWQHYKRSSVYVAAIVALLTVMASCTEPDPPPTWAADPDMTLDAGMDMADMPDAHDMPDARDMQDDLAEDMAPVGCNGHEALCERRLPEITLATSHNGMSNGEDGWIAYNHLFPLAHQLEQGVRGFLLDVYEEEGELWLCHGYCNLGKIALGEALTIFDDFLADHPRDVVLLLFEDYISGEQMAEAVRASGLIDRVFTPEQDGDGRILWPTLDEMTSRGQQLVVTSQNTSGPEAWYLRFYDIGFDTPYAFKKREDFSCDRLRGAGDDLFLVNHWLGELPTIPAAREANAFDVLYARVVECGEAHAHQPNLLAVDFVSIGDLMRAVDTLNGFE